MTKKKPDAAPRPWDWTWVGARASGGGHVYLTDAKGRKIAAIWGAAGEKEATADLILKAVQMYDGVEGAIEEAAQCPTAP